MKHLHPTKREWCMALLLLLVSPAFACTSFLVGRLASADGSAFITYNQDDYGMFGRLSYYPAADHPKGTMRAIVEGDTGRPLGSIPEAAHTYAVMGYINEHQVGVTETTFGGREELMDPKGVVDYTTLMTLALQRAKTAREAIRVMTSLVNEYGYASSGESFSICDPNEIWILEMIGKGPDQKGVVWVAVRIPDDCISCHANQSRIHRFDMKDKKNVMCSPDVISFARSKGYFDGPDSEFSFSQAYAPADFSALRICDARAWSFFNHFVEGMDKYIPSVDGRHIGTAEPLPLWFKPSKPVSLSQVMDAMRDHYEGTPFDLTSDPGCGLYTAPYRPTPLFWDYKGKKYFHERPISTQQTAASVVVQVRSSLPNPIGGVIWFANDDANMAPYVPVHCGATAAPACFDPKDADEINFSENSAFWMQNWVANMVYPRYSRLFPDLLTARREVENRFLEQQADFEKQMLALSKQTAQLADSLTQHAAQNADFMMKSWKHLATRLIVKHNDQTVRSEKDGKFERDEFGRGKRPTRLGADSLLRGIIVKEAGERYLVP